MTETDAAPTGGRPSTARIPWMGLALIVALVVGALADRATGWIAPAFDFVAHQYDVLLATTIIENGLDIPNANTIIINRADRYGLAQLYQLRGRVGRSDRPAYAYLLIPPQESLSPVARKRLFQFRLHALTLLQACGDDHGLSEEVVG